MVEGADSQRLSLHEEEVSILRRRVNTTNVKVATQTYQRDVLVEEDLAHDRVEIKRVPIDRVVDAPVPPRIVDDTTIFSVVEEIVVIERRLVLKEEIHVRRVQETERMVEVVSVRRQEATVTRTSVPRELSKYSSLPVMPPHTKASSMTDETIVAVYDAPESASLAVQDLVSSGISRSAITEHANTTEASAPAVREPGFWSRLFGGEPEYDTALYDRSLDTGSTVISVVATEIQAADVVTILEKHHPVDMDERASSYGFTQTTGLTAAATIPPAPLPQAGTTAEGASMQLSEERLAVGKRLLNRGGTRIRRYVVETPVEETVTLRDEKVVLERKPVTGGRPVAEGSFTDKTIEMTESTEEAVISKTAHVYEEVGLRKEAIDRTETIHDTVRKEEAEVERIPGKPATPAGTVDPLVGPRAGEV